MLLERLCFAAIWYENIEVRGILLAGHNLGNWVMNVEASSGKWLLLALN